MNVDIIKHRIIKWFISKLMFISLIFYLFLFYFGPWLNHLHQTKTIKICNALSALLQIC